MTSSLISKLREHDQRLRQVPVTLSADIRIRRHLREAAATRRPHARWMVPLCGSLLVTVALLLWTARRPSADAPTEAGVRLLPSAACKISEQQAKTLLQGGCTLKLGAITLSSERATRIERRTDGDLMLLDGHALFDVTASQTPVRLQVGGGTIEVVGTRFIVTQDDRQGSVELLEGRIRFLSHGRAPIELRPGETFSWNNTSAAQGSSLVEPQPSAPAASGSSGVEPARGPALTGVGPRRASAVAATSVPSAVVSERHRQLDEAVARVLDLGGLGRYREALDAIQALNGSVLDSRSREALSYERGSILWRMGERAASCTHWAAHLQRFPGGSYRGFVERRLASQCSRSSSGGNSGGSGG